MHRLYSVRVEHQVGVVHLWGTNVPVRHGQPIAETDTGVWRWKQEALIDEEKTP